MFTKVPMGSQVKSLSIPRADVAVGAKKRVILLDPDPAVKQCVFMEFGEGENRRGRMVEFDQDSMLRYRVRPKPIYYFLVAAVACDMRLQPVGDEFTVEYLQLSASQYQELVNQIDAAGGEADFNTAILSKDKRTNEKGQDVSTVKAAFAKITLSPELQERIDETAQNEKLMQGLWAMLDAQTSMNVSQWEEFCAANGVQAIQSPASSGASNALPSVKKPQLPKPEEIETPQGESGIEGDPMDGFENDDFK